LTLILWSSGVSHVVHVVIFFGYVTALMELLTCYPTIDSTININSMSASVE